MTQPEPRKAAFCFTRVSSDEQAAGLSIESQEANIADWCAQRGYEIVETVRAEGESAYTDDIKKRPQFAKLLERLKLVRPYVVVVYSLDRWARSLVVSSATIHQLRDWGVLFASVTEHQFDFTNPASDLQYNLLACFAQYSSDMTAQHVRRVNDLKFEKGLHRGPAPFGYIPDPTSTRADSKPCIPEEGEFPVVQELFRRMLSGKETYRSIATWLNSKGLTTRNRLRTAAEDENGEPPKPRKFTEESVRSIAKNPFYAGFVVKGARAGQGADRQDPVVRTGLHIPAVSPEDFNRVQSIIKLHYRAPRSASPKFRPYLGKSLLRCVDCGEKAWCHHIKSIDYYQESSASRGIACDAAGRYWPAAMIDHQIEQIMRPVALPADWKERALELANAENNVLDLQSERISLERKRRRIIELYKEDMIDRVEFERELGALDNRLKTVSPADVQFAEVTIADFEKIQSFWDKAVPGERASLLTSFAEKLYVDFATGQLLEIVPKSGFRYVLEAAQITRPVSGSELTNGDPEGIRTPDLHRDRVACLTATPRGRVPNRF